MSRTIEFATIDYPAMGDKDIHEITAETIQQYINSKANKLAAKTIREEIHLPAPVCAVAIEK